MRILLVTARYFPHRGGLETVVHHLAQEFCRAGHQVFIVTNRYPRTLPADEVIDDVPVRRLLFLFPQIRFLREKRADLWVASFWYIAWSTWELLRLIRHYDPHVINLHYLGAPAFFVLLLKSRLAFPWIVSLHGGDVDGEPYRSRFSAWLFRSVTKLAEIVTACSEDLANQAVQLSTNLSEKVRVIYNGVDCHRFTSAVPYVHPRPYVLAVGQLVPHKGFDLLIEAFGDASIGCTEADLLIAGEGNSREELLQLICKRRLSGRVHLLGRVDERTVASLMAGSLFVVVPSRREPFGIVALEAMAAGKRVLATPVGGIPEFLPSGLNHVVKPDRGAWAEALTEWLSMSRDDLNGAANLNCAQRFGWARVAEQYLEVYSQARANGNAN